MSHCIALIHKDPESGNGVSFPDVLGVAAVADTLDDDLREASVAIAFAFEDRSGERHIPRTLDALRDDPGYRL